MKVWVTGASGLLGQAFRHILGRHEIPAVRTGREVDITDAGAVQAFAAEERPTHVINCAGYTRVDDAESDEAAAFAVNAAGTGNVARAAREIGALLVHFSTDYVFDGAGRLPYREGDACSPAGAYGRTKREGERRVLEAFGMSEVSRRPTPTGASEEAHPAFNQPTPAGEEAGRAYIVRTSWLFGEGGDNFVTTMLRLMRERDAIEVVADQHGRPTYTRDVAMAALVLAGIIERSVTDRESTRDDHRSEPYRGPARAVEQIRRGASCEPADDAEWTASSTTRAPGGIYHFANAGATTWHGFASEIQRQAADLGLAPSVRTIVPIATAASGRRAPRPAYSVLATDRIEALLHESPRSWQLALADYLEGMVNARASS